MKRNVPSSVESPQDIGQRATSPAGAGGRVRTGLTGLVTALHRSLNPVTEAEARMVSAQLTIISDSTRFHGILLPGIAIVIALNFVQTVAPLRILAWLIPVVILFAGATLTGRYRPPDNPKPAFVASSAKAFTLTSGVLTTVWCAMIPALWVPGDTLNHVTLVLIIASSLASASSINAPHLTSGAVSMAVYGVTLIVAPFAADGSINVFFLAMAVVFWISMVFQMRSNYLMTRRMLSLQEERTDLIDDLTLAKIESDRARERAEEASLAKSQFLANMSHELRTPLNAILGFSELIHADIGGERPGRHKEYAKLVHDSGVHLLALINDILDLAKIEAGGLHLREGNLDLSELIAETTGLMRGKAETGGVTMRCEICGTMPPVYADGRALKQVLLNLLSNALKYTPPGGEVATFAYVDESGAAAFGVRDTGVGIAEEDLPRVFEKFGQGRHDVVTMEKGTGLGLAIVKGLVSAHGGEVTLVSRICEGTSVTIRLPAERCYGPAQLRSAS